MTEADLIEVVRTANDATAALYGQLISITFAMIVAIFYFLNRSRWPLKLLAFGVYSVGYLMFVGLMLETSNTKHVALRALGALPSDRISPFTAGLIDLQSSWLFQATALFMNAGLWLLGSAVVFMMFVWRKPATLVP